MSAGAPPAAPRLARRLACLLYEGVLLFGVVMIGGVAYAVLTQQRHALEGKAGLQAFVFLLLAMYFSWFWSHGGQTLAMKTWHLRLVRLDGRPLSPGQALARFVASWMRFVPALLVLWASGLRSAASAAGVIVLGVAGYASLALLRADRRLLHDVVCGTQLIDWRPATSARKSRAAPSLGSGS